MAAEPITDSSDALSEVLTTDFGFKITYPSTWSKPPQRFTNMLELINESAPTARIGITGDNLSSETVVLRQIQDIQAGLGAPETAYISIGSFSAFQYTWIEEREQPDHGPKYSDTHVRRVSTAIAAGKQLIRIEAWLPSDASVEMIEEVKQIGRSITFSAAVKATVISSASSLSLGNLGVQQSTSDTIDSGAAATKSPLILRNTAILGAAESFDLGPGFVDQIFANGNGEVEIAASPDGQFIVIGRQSWWSYSQDGGSTFTNGGRIPFSNGDPSLAYGLSGNFYYAGIDENDGGGFPPGSPGTGSGQCPGPDGASAFGYSCTGIAVSTDSGQNFPTASIVNAVVCPQADDLDGSGSGSPAAGACFPDQEHIAADRFNAGSGGDQVYSTWRSFPGGIASIVCSQNSGQTWTAPAVVEAAGKFPRIAVGQDGFVYVAYYTGAGYRLAKYSSCANGLAPQPQVTVHARNTIVCPFVGHDRCDQNPSSQMVAVDDINPNHIYYAYAETAGSPGADQVVVQDSLDGGATWARPRVRVNNNILGKRIMPWVCTTGGEAFVTWYDRRNASIPNDRTDFYGGSVHLDQDGNLIAEADFKINEVPDDWCSAGWPCGTRGAPEASEQCSVQPQLAGICRDANNANTGRCDFSDCGGVGNNSGASCQCPAGSTCNAGNGCPKYGDYNGNACIAGRLLAAWASATPTALPTSPPIGILFSQVIVGDVPQIQVPNAVTIDPICPGDVGRGKLEVCNTGTATLEVQSIASSDLDFTVTTPSAGYPLLISHDFCFDFEVVFDPSTSGPDNATLTITSNDPANPELDVEASGDLGEASLDTFIANSGDFGEVCEGGFKDLDLTVTNGGVCPLQITSVTLSGAYQADFELPASSVAGSIVAPGNSMQIPVRFAPDDFTPLVPRTASVDVSGETLNSGVSLGTDSTTVVVGTVPPPDIQAVIANSGDFGNVCKGDHADLDLRVFNQGRCDLTIDSISLWPDAGSFELPNNLTFPLVVSHDAEFTVPVRYSPDACNDEVEERVIVIASDDPDENPVNVDISGTSPCPHLVIDPIAVTGMYSFPATVVDADSSLGCFTDQSVTLRNTGNCPLTISDIGAAGDFDVDAYAVIAPTVLPIILPTGEETLDVTIRFTPKEDDDPLEPSEVTGLLTIVSDDPDFPHAADLCGESVTQSGIRILVTDVSTGIPDPVVKVDSIDISSKGKKMPSPIKLQFTDQPFETATVCDNEFDYHVNLETLPSVATTGSNPKSSYSAKAREGNLQAEESFKLGQCEFREFQLQLKDSDSLACSPLLLPKGESCETDLECCSYKCKGPSGGKTCK